MIKTRCISRVLVFLLVGCFFYVGSNASAEDISCDEGYFLHNGNECSKICEVDGDCLGDEYCLDFLNVCEKDCQATTLETSCGPISVENMQTHVSNDTFSQGETRSIYCHNGEFRVQISDYSDDGFCSNTCGDGICRGLSEDCSSCPSDCGSCSDVFPSVITNPPAETYQQSSRQRVGGWRRTKLEAEEVTFEWTSPIGLGSAKILEVGTCLDDPSCQSDIFLGETLPAHLFIYPESNPDEAFPNINLRSHQVSGIPLDGNPLYVRLKQFDNTQNVRFLTTYVYDTINNNPHIESPIPGNVLNQEKVLFSCGGKISNFCIFLVGSQLGTFDYGYQVYSYDPNNYSAAFRSTVSLPLDGSKVYVRMYHWDSDWSNFGYLDEEYKMIYCGNGIKEKAEYCDDGNRENADGCSDQCSSEAALGTEITPPLGSGDFWG